MQTHLDDPPVIAMLHTPEFLNSIIPPCSMLKTLLVILEDSNKKAHKLSNSPLFPCDSNLLCNSWIVKAGHFSIMYVLHEAYYRCSCLHIVTCYVGSKPRMNIMVLEKHYK